MLPTAAWIGHRVSLPAAPAELRAGGVTSRGVFLFTPAEEVIFLSTEPYRGPLTINLTANPPQVRPGDPVRFEGWELRFPGSTRLSLETARAWAPPPPPASQAAPPVRTALIRAVAAEILANNPRAGLAPLLGPLCGLPFPPLPAELHTAEQILSAPDRAAALPALLGLGRGLTPSGDDFIAGYLLAASRAGSGHPAGFTAAARTRTTTLSAALIAAAAAGSADERLLRACDALLSADQPPAEIYALLAAYGSSSGLDAFAGIAAFVLSI
jgi:hypothetical protein